MSPISWILEDYLKRTNSFIRFLLVGVFNTFIGLSIMYVLMFILDRGYWTSTFIGNGIGTVVSFLLNRSFTFNSNISFLRGGVSFLAVVLFCYFGSYTVSDKVAHLFSTSYTREMAVICGMILYTISNYFGQKYFVFARDTSENV